MVLKSVWLNYFVFINGVHWVSRIASPLFIISAETWVSFSLFHSFILFHIFTLLWWYGLDFVNHGSYNRYPTPSVRSLPSHPHPHPSGTTLHSHAHSAFSYTTSCISHRLLMSSVVPIYNFYYEKWKLCSKLYVKTCFLFCDCTVTLTRDCRYMVLFFFIF